MTDGVDCQVVIGLGSCGIAAGASALLKHAKSRLQNRDGVELGVTSCVGMCHAEPIVELRSATGRIVYGEVDLKLLDSILDAAVNKTEAPKEKRVSVNPKDSSFFSRQQRIVLRNCGILDPESIDDALTAGGYEGLKKAVKIGSEEIIRTILDSGLRGRGGGGFPTGMKWKFLASAPSPKYMVCNADEGDPGAFMDRAILEGDPHGVIEGMAIAAFATGAEHGVIYCRAEYPLAIARLEKAIQEAADRNLLGENILGSGFSFHLKVKEGAGAFVCGEETALMASIEGKRGMPRLRPPFPAQSGIKGRPTNINNVETFANVPFILREGAEAFNRYSCGKSTGTKVFALAGKIRNGGLVEVPMGVSIREVVEDIGGGTPDGSPVKAVQLGGPAGGCVPLSLFDTKIDYDSINSTGAIMGSGGLVVMDQGTCMVDVARYFLSFTQKESCGKCTFCRIGTRRMLEILENICDGKGNESDIEELQSLGKSISKTSLCGLGQLASNPVLTTIRYFRDEYEAHIRDHRCPAGACTALITIIIDAEKCTGCTLCKRSCPVNAISGEAKQLHVIDPEVCTRCGICIETCKRFKAIKAV